MSTRQGKDKTSVIKEIIAIEIRMSPTLPGGALGEKAVRVWLIQDIVRVYDNDLAIIDVIRKFLVSYAVSLD